MVWRQTTVFACLAGTEPEVCRGNSQGFYGVDQSAASDASAVSSSAEGRWAENPALGGRQSQGSNGRVSGSDAPGVGCSGVADMADQGHPERAAGLARQTRA